MDHGLASTRRLRRLGMTTRNIRDGVLAGTLLRVRRGWYAKPGIPRDLLTAARAGGRLTCLGALRLHGCWVPESHEVHVRVADGVTAPRSIEARVHGTPDRVGPGVDAAEEALRCASRCLDVRALVVVADSLVNRGILSPREVSTILESTPRGRRALALHDPDAESGIETMVRLALRRHRMRVRSQVVVPDVGRVDFLVGERLIIEADGYEWHADPERFERDRARDRELVRRGYVVLRVSYRQAHHDLDGVTRAVLDVVRRRDHRWRAVHRSQLSSWGYPLDLSSMKGPRSES